MSFSAFNVGRQMVTFTGNVNPKQNFGSKPIAGGSFTPNTLEAAFVMRSSLDYQFEKAFVDKHRATMQNRLNELSKKMNEAYTDLLNVSMSQQIGEKADRNLRADVRLDGSDGTTAANLLNGIMGENGFEDLGLADQINGQTALNYATPGSGNSGNNIWRAPNKGVDGLDGTIMSDDGNFGYSRNIGGIDVQFRTLMERTTAAGNVAGDVHITMREEDDPPEPVELETSLDILNSITSAILGGPADPTYFNQKIQQESTNYKTAGFWSAVNYLYNFAPREIKYSYAVGYTVNSDEAGNDEYLINGEVVNAYDVPNDNYDANGNLTSSDAQGYLKKDNRLKWNSFDPTEGYQHERSGTSRYYPDIINRQKSWITNPNANGPAWDTTPTAAEGEVQIVDGLIFQSGTYKFDAYQDALDLDGDGNINEFQAYFVNSSGVGGALAGTNTIGGTVYQYAANNQGAGLTNLLNSNIQTGSVFRNKVDMGVNGANDNVTPATSSSDQVVNARGALRSSLFFNHYEVETRTVEFNNKSRVDVPELTAAPTNGVLTDDAAGNLYVYGGIKRSTSVDASKNYDWVDTDGDGTPDEISRSSGNVANSFNGEFIQSQHKIHSVNGQTLVSNDTKQASPTIGNFEIGRYEGVLRSYEMNRNVVEYTGPSEMEVDAANSVPTDWHQAELLVNPNAAAPASNPADPANGFIWFPFVEDTLYSGVPPLVTGYGRENGPRQVIQARNSFTLKQDEYMQLRPANEWVADASGVRRPTYSMEDMWVDIDLTGVHYDLTASPPQIPRIFVNGREVTVTPTTVTPLGGANNHNLRYRVNLTNDQNINNVYPPTNTPPFPNSYLREGMNTFTIQASDGTYLGSLGNANYSEGIRVSAVTAMNSTKANAVLNGKIITGYSDIDQLDINGNTVTTFAEVVYNDAMNRPNTVKAQSRWQTRVVPQSTEMTTKLVQASSDPAYTGTSNKTANSFVELIISFMNQQKYRDIFKLGMLSHLDKLLITGQANLPSGSSMEGFITMHFDQATQDIVLFQDKLIAKS